MEIMSREKGRAAPGGLSREQGEGIFGELCSSFAAWMFCHLIAAVPTRPGLCFGDWSSH